MPEPQRGGRMRLAERANQAVLPLYVLHQTVIVLIGYVVVERWGASWVVGFPLIFLASLVATVFTYEFGIRPWRPMRVLFGMKEPPLPRVAAP